MRTRRILAVLALPAALSWASAALALDRERALEVAKQAAGDKCSDARPCSFDARRAEGKWHVRVDFAKEKGKPGGHAIYIIDETGRIVGRVER